MGGTFERAENQLENKKVLVWYYRLQKRKNFPLC